MSVLFPDREGQALQGEIVGVFHVEAHLVHAETSTMYAIEIPATLEASDQGVTDARVGHLILTDELHVPAFVAPQ